MNDKCGKCGGATAEGFIFDRGDGDYRRQQTWVEGAPQSSFWTGVKTSGKTAFLVRAMRCAGCGFLEFYADQPSDATGTFSRLFGG